MCLCYSFVKERGAASGGALPTWWCEVTNTWVHAYKQLHICKLLCRTQHCSDSMLLAILKYQQPCYIVFIVIYLYFILDIKDSIYFCVPCVWYVLCRMQDVCAHRQVQHLYLSTWSVTKHGDQSPSLMGVNWVSDGVSIDFIEYMCYKGVRFYSSLKRMIIIDSWERNGAIPMRTRLLLLSNRLQGFRWNRTILD